MSQDGIIARGDADVPTQGYRITHTEVYFKGHNILTSLVKPVIPTTFHLNETQQSKTNKSNQCITFSNVHPCVTQTPPCCKFQEILQF
jgi:hypothetical protein